MTDALPKSRGATVAAGLISLALFIACLSVAVWLIAWISGVVYGLGLRPEVLECRLYGSVWDLPVTRYAPCITNRLLVWWQAAGAFMEIDFQPGMEITARVLWHLAKEGIAILACVLIPGWIILLLAKLLAEACGRSGDAIVAEFRIRTRARAMLVPERQEPKV